MKKSLLALAALGAFASAASAQSSVTIFGVVDLAARNVSAGGKSMQQLVPDAYNSNRLGFRGVEALGGGMSAAVWLEAGMDPSVGTAGGGNGNYNAAVATCSTSGSATAGTVNASCTAANTNPNSSAAPSAPPAAFFNRRATVSLLGAFGELRLGRDYTPSFWNSTVFDPFGTNGAGSFTNVIDGAAAGTNALGTNAQTYVRANNSIGYFLPGGLGGLYGQVMVAAFDGSPTTQLPKGNKHQSFRLGYGSGPINVAFSSGRTTNGSSALTYKHDNLAGAYDMGAAKLFAQYNKVSTTGKSQKSTLLGVSVPMGATELRASYVSADGSGAAADNKDAKQMAFGFVHNMSKRTALFGTYSKIDNSNVGVWNHGTLAPTTGGNSTAYEVGVRHSF